ncbi:MAG TPA: DUF2267 domain-containing protein [Micromonosporaceae bacterium]|nr:DUF2267 domain-containing protein [Micromonosporaceae bacterium]
MNYETFIDRVAQRAGVSSDQAVILTRATLETLADRLTAGEALDLAAQLPKRLQMPLRPREETAERFSLAECIRRVGERAGVDEAAAANGVRAVFATLRQAVTGGEFEDLLAQLPSDFAEVAEPVAVRSGRRR